MATKKKILITGAAGYIGSYLRRYWGDRYDLRLADIKPVEDLAAHEQAVKLDIAEYEPFLNACQEIDTVVHLAADPSMQAEFYDTLLPLNIIGCYNAFEAARQAGCKRLIFASSVNAIAGYNNSEHEGVKWDAPIFPVNVYGATKCWGEALARVYSSQHGLSCICVRIGAARFSQAQEFDAERQNMGLSARDGAQLFGRCVEVEALDFAIVNGTSKHQRSFMDLEYTSELLDYEPENGTAFPPAEVDAGE